MSAQDDSGRSFGFLEHFAFWATLSAGLYVMPFGSLLVPALSIEQAVLATAIAALIAGLLIAAIATAAARTGSTTLEPIAPWRCSSWCETWRSPRLRSHLWPRRPNS